MRIELSAPPPHRRGRKGCASSPFDPERDASAFHAAHQEAFADHWGHTPRDLPAWSKLNLASERFDPTLWCVVRAVDAIPLRTVLHRRHDVVGFAAIETRRPVAAGVGAALGRAWALGARRAGGGRGGERERHRRAPRARRDGPALGWVDVREGARRCCVTGAWRGGARRGRGTSLAWDQTRDEGHGMGAGDMEAPPVDADALRSASRSAPIDYPGRGGATPARLTRSSPRLGPGGRDCCLLAARDGSFSATRESARCSMRWRSRRCSPSMGAEVDLQKDLVERARSRDRRTEAGRQGERGRAGGGQARTGDSERAAVGALR